MILLASLLEPRDQVEHHRHLVDAHAGGRLVEHEDLRLERDHHARLRACAGRRATARCAAIARACRPSATRSRMASARSIRSCAAYPRPQHVVMHAGARLAPRAGRSPATVRLRKQIGELERAADAGAGAQRRAKPRDIGAVEQDAAAGRGELSGDQIEIGGLAGAVRADDRGQLAGAKAQLTRVRPRRDRRSGWSGRGFRGSMGCDRSHPGECRSPLAARIEQPLAPSFAPRRGAPRAVTSALVADRNRSCPRS